MSEPRGILHWKAMDKLKMTLNEHDEYKKKLHIIGECWREVHSHFKNKGKTLFWFAAENPLLGCSPIHMIQIGREEKLLKFVKGCKEGNSRE